MVKENAMDSKTIDTLKELRMNGALGARGYRALTDVIDSYEAGQWTAPLPKSSAGAAAPSSDAERWESAREFCDRSLGGQQPLVWTLVEDRDAQWREMLRNGSLSQNAFWERKNKPMGHEYCHGNNDAFAFIRDRIPK